LIKIAFDAMGGDHAPKETIRGACLAIKESPEIEIIFVGKEDVIQKEIASILPNSHPRIKIHHASEIVDMGEPPAQAFRKKKNSSIHVGLNLVKSGEADAFISAGNTGAVMATATILLGKIQNVDRPAIATVLPSQKGGVICLDMGSSVDCRPNHLFQFALMGSFYSKLVLGIENPRVGLLSIGEEEDKGNALTLATYPLLKESNLNFIGNIEGKDILSNTADVIVCDGFIGNSILKFGEGVVKLFFNFFKTEFKGSILSKIGLICLTPALKRFKKRFDYEEFGGAPLLGVNKVVIIAHGKSSAKAIKNAILCAEHSVKSQIVEKIRGGLAS
jgi:glycerol-3-phosphate acyltransferase PlsX